MKSLLNAVTKIHFYRIFTVNDVYLVSSFILKYNIKNFLYKFKNYIKEL